MRLNALEPGSFGVSNGKAAGQALNLVATDLRHIPHKLGDHLVLVLDNGESAALWDPADHRLSAFKTWLDSLKALVDEGLLPSNPRLSLVVLGQGTVSQPVTNGTVHQLTTALSTHPSILAPGGRAPLWDGIVTATDLLKGAEGQLLVYWGSVGDGSSAATRAQARSLTRQTPVLAVVGPGASTDELTSLVKADNGGALVSATTSVKVSARIQAVGRALLGRWQLVLSAKEGLSLFPGLPTSGTVTLELFQERWTDDFQLPLLER